MTAGTLERGLRLARLAAGVIRPSAQARRVAPWFAIDGDRTLRLEYDLGPSSTVLDVGGYEGQWASDIFGRYACTVHVFEPVPAFADRIAARFAANPRVVPHPYGLAGSSRDAYIALHADGSSVIDRGDREQVPIRLVGVDEAFAALELGEVDLMKVNIEGLEYELVERLLETGFLARVRDLQVQFHDFVPDAEQRMRALRRRLAATHTLTYDFPFVWENWRRR